ncbi:MAG: formate--phosphoribosylaminoimidazolecarboxamide ligase [Candidatus Altiarchaeota archaeon]
MARIDVKDAVKGYDRRRIRIATIGSHSALNIFKGAKDEGFKTLGLCLPGGDKLYRRYDLIDDVIFVEKYEDIINEEVQEQLRQKNAIIIPHGSFNAYIKDGLLEEKFNVPIFGNRSLLKWETSRQLQREWLKNAGLNVPKVYQTYKDIDGLAFVKFPGAKGGKGYFIVDSPEAYEKKMRDMVKRGLVTKEDAKRPYIQEYIVGVSTYPHYFYSPLNEGIELLGVDKRYESAVDGISRIPVPEQLEQKINPSFTIVGNFPMVLRESLLSDVFDMGERIVEESKKIAPPGVIGPFCLETICKENLQLIAFEISARIVAGCNVNIGSSPYTYLKYKENMYMGRRIAREIKEAIKSEELDRVLT